MTRNEAISELVRIWHSPHLDLILKARLGEVIETLKEKNQSDSLVRDDAENCKESESKLDLISRQDAIEVLTETIAPPSVTLDTLVVRIDALPSAEAVEGWIPVTERLPSKEEMKEWIDNNLDGIGYLYPCLVTRYSSINPGRTKCNPYVAKHYFDGEDFVNNGEEVCSEYIIAWMPLPEPYKGGDDE